MATRIKKVVLLVLLAVFVASLCFNVNFLIRESEDARTDSVTTTYIDTIPYLLPIPKDSIVIKYITRKLPTADSTGNNGVENIPENGNISIENIQDSVKVVIPITQKRYEDSTYTAYVSGYMPSLDSILVYPKREVTIITNRASSTKRWGIGIQAGYGIQLKGTPQFAPYIGVGITYNLFSF